MKVQELINLVSEVENKQVKNHSRDENYYYIYPIDSVGEPKHDASARPTINFEVTDHEVVLRLLYLNVRSKGLGTKIIKWLINYCISENIDKILIRCVEKNNIIMNALAKKFGFTVSKEDKGYLYYELEV